jgi:hypothetical protein
MGHGGVTWVEYEIHFESDEETANAALAFMKSLDDESYDYEISTEENELLKGRNEGEWVITYGARGHDEGPVEDLCEKFPELDVFVRVVGVQYD